jgi:coenzyme F420-0:L-glutamate ligase / coenzyme F420-1:gamma-L-glutamate ligase
MAAILAPVTVPVVTALAISAVEDLPEIEAGADLAALVAARADLVDGDVVVVTSKVVSKAEGAVVELASVAPSAFAVRFAESWDKDPRLVEVVLAQAARIVRMSGPILITETHHGFVCANSGVDQSSSGAAGRVVVLPRDPDASAAGLRRRFAELGADVAVIVSDTFGRPWREGQTDVAIGVAGMAPIVSYVGQLDPHGHEFRVQALCVVDELAGAAELVKGNTSRMPVAVIRGYAWERDDTATIASVLRDPAHDLFR